MFETTTAVGKYADLTRALAKSFAAQFIKADGSLTVETQSAAVLAISSGILGLLETMEPKPFIEPVVKSLVDRIAKNDYRMATGFLGTKPLLSVLTRNGQHDLACRLFQSRKFPSWGYEVEQGATSVWERWDSFTKEHGFDGATGKNNAAMNSFSHYSFGAVMEWAFRDLAGLDVLGFTAHSATIHPHIPSPASNPDGKPLDWVRVSYDHPRGRFVSAWKREGGKLIFDITIPANMEAFVILPAKSKEAITENGVALSDVFKPQAGGNGSLMLLTLPSGTYHFEVTEAPAPAPAK